MARAQQVPAMSNPGVIVLNQNTKREQGKKAQLGNIAAANPSPRLRSVRSIRTACGAATRPPPLRPWRRGQRAGRRAEKRGWQTERSKTFC